MEQKMSTQLDGKVAFITGGASGIGIGMARAFAGVGMKIAIADIDAETLEKAASDLKSTGATVLAVPPDVTDTSSSAAAVNSTDKLGPVQLLCNNAGISTFGLNIESVNPALWDKIVSINLNGVFYGIYSFYSQLRSAGWGHIVNTGSIGRSVRRRQWGGSI
jgi:NAD(P)-dependent dehydrogenase (short-subunit alcohol dehydrogenase family)